MVYLYLCAPCRCVQVCKCVSGYICICGVWLSEVRMHDCLFMCWLEPAYVFARFLCAHDGTASGPVCIWEHVGTWVICA